MKDSVVGIVAGYKLDDRGAGILVPVGLKIITSPHRADRLWGAPNLLSSGYRGALSPGVKREGYEADLALPTSAEVKKTWIYTSTPPHVFTA
jgi:hypothetical protein